VDSSDNIYVTGYTGGGLDNNTLSGGEDIFLVKYNSSGVKQWTKQHKRIISHFGKGTSMTMDNSSNVYMTGSTSSVFDNNTHFGNYDIFLVKYNSSGTKQWTKQLGTSCNDSGNGVAVDSSGNIYVTGYSHCSTGLEGNSSPGGKDIFLAKYNDNGTKQWIKQYGNSSDQEGMAVTVDSSNNIYVTGYTYGDLDGNTNSAGNGSDIFLSKYYDNGNKQWTKQLGTSGNDYGYGVTVDSSNNVYLTGSTQGGLHENTNSGNSDIFLVKYNSSGTKQWTKQLGTSSNDSGQSVAVDLSNNIYVTGATQGGFDGNDNTLYSDIFLVKYNSSGTKQWTKQLGSTSHDGGNGVAVDLSNNIYVTGGTQGGLDGNNNLGGYDIFLVKYNSDGVLQ